MQVETEGERPAPPQMIRNLRQACAELGIDDESGLDWTIGSAHERLGELYAILREERRAHRSKGAAVATEIDTKEAVRTSPEQLVTQLESFYHASRGYTNPETQLTVSIALLQHHDMERIARSLDRIANAIDSEVGLSVTAHVEES